jgi:hypothetical protein
MKMPARGCYYWLLLEGASSAVPAKLGYAGWYIIGENRVVQETAIRYIGPLILYPLDEKAWTPYGEVKATMERDV